MAFSSPSHYVPSNSVNCFKKMFDDDDDDNDDDDDEVLTTRN